MNAQRDGLTRLQFLVVFLILAPFVIGWRNAQGIQVAFFLLLLMLGWMRLLRAGRSGWWALFALVPGVNLLFALACLVLPDKAAQA